MVVITESLWGMLEVEIASMQSSSFLNAMWSGASDTGFSSLCVAAELVMLIVSSWQINEKAIFWRLWVLFGKAEQF